jgi:GDP-L-fucose synthase
MSDAPSRIFVAGHRGMVGSAILRQLLAEGVTPKDIITRSHAELDLTNQATVQAFFEAEQPTQVYLAAAKVGGHPRQQHLPGRLHLSKPDDAGHCDQLGL